MGYYTRFELSWKPTNKFKGNEDDLNNAVGNYIEKHNLYGVDRNGETTDSVKWYESKEDVKNMSLEIKNVIFHLSAEGEESGDIWDFYALDGKTQLHKAEIIRGQLDLKAWK